MEEKKVYYSQLDNEIFLYEDADCEIEHREISFTIETLLSETLGLSEYNIKQGNN